MSHFGSFNYELLFKNILIFRFYLFIFLVASVLSRSHNALHHVDDPEELRLVGGAWCLGLGCGRPSCGGPRGCEGGGWPPGGGLLRGR